MKSRREFLQLSGMGLLAAGFPGFIKPNHATRLARLSVQLYTVRDQIKLDIKGTLKRVADIGFKHVETAFWPETVSIDQAAGYLKEYGLQVSSSHIELPFGDQQQLFLDKARAYQCKKMIWHGWPEDKRYSSLEGTRELIDLYKKANRFARDHGLEFGLHNHWWEYRNKINGKLVYEVLAQELDPDIFFEVDTYWVKVAGQDPAAVVAKLGDRVKMMHIKDGPAVFNEKLFADNPDPMTAVGKGTQNFPAIIKAAENHPQWLVVEMDKTATDVFEALQQSFDYMIQNKLAAI